MKSFDLDAAKRGAAVCTRGGKQARIICLDADNPLFIIIAMVRDTLSGKETPQSYRDDGGWLPASTECNQDLMMRDDDYAEKLARGEYAPSVKENLTVENPTCKESLPVDREYWRRVYAGQAMPTILSLFATNNATVRSEYKDMDSRKVFAITAIELADALIEELEKTEKQRPKL